VTEFERKEAERRVRLGLSKCDCICPRCNWEGPVILKDPVCPECKATIKVPSDELKQIRSYRSYLFDIGKMS